MRRPTPGLPVLLVLALCFCCACDTTTNATPDAGASDGGTTPPDGGAPSDGGPPPDAGPDVAPCAPGDYVGDNSWPEALVVESGARLCAYDPDTSTRAIADLIALKSVGYIPAGTYPLPDADASRSFRLPFCVEHADGTDLAPGNAPSVTAQQAGGIVDPFGFYVRATLPMDGMDMSLSVGREPSATNATLGTAPAEQHLLGVVARWNGRLYTSCELAPNRCWTLELDSGETLRVDEYVYVASVGTGFASVPRVRGVVGGVSIDVSGYERTTSTYGHHAFWRTHYVEPAATLAGGACGLRIDVNVSSSLDATVSYADCDGVAGTQLGMGEVTQVSCDTP